MRVSRLAKAVLVASSILAVGGLYIWKAPKWMQGFQPFLVHGQATPSGSTEMFLDPVIPFIAVGSFDGGRTRYSTVIQITGSSNAVAAVISAEFLNSNGTSFPATFRTNRTPNFTGVLPAGILLPFRQTLVITADQDETGMIGWGRILVSGSSRFGSGSAVISTTVETRDMTTGNIIYRFPVDSTVSTGLMTFVLQRVSGASGTDVGFVLVNNSSMPANITATLRDANGSLLNSRMLQLGPTNQILYYVPTFFSLGPELLETNYTNLLFESDVPLAAIALASGGTAPFVTVPISRFP